MKHEAGLDGRRSEIIRQVIAGPRSTLPHDDGNQSMRSPWNSLRQCFGLVENKPIDIGVSRVLIAFPLLGNDKISLLLGKRG